MKGWRIMKKICKLLSFLLICTLGATVLSGCGEKKNVATTTNEAYVMDENLNPPGEFPVCKEKITFHKINILDKTIS